MYIGKSGGTATIIFQNSQTTIGQSVKLDYTTRSSNAAYITISGIIQVTVSGTLTIGSAITTSGTSPTITGKEGYAFFLKKA